MSKASPELLRHLDDTPRDELLGWFNVLCRHLALCVDPFSFAFQLIAFITF